MEIARIGEAKAERDQPKNAPKRGRRRAAARPGDAEEPAPADAEPAVEGTDAARHIDVVA